MFQAGFSWIPGYARLPLHWLEGTRRESDAGTVERKSWLSGKRGGGSSYLSFLCSLRAYFLNYLTYLYLLYLIEAINTHKWLCRWICSHFSSNGSSTVALSNGTVQSTHIRPFLSWRQSKVISPRKSRLSPLTASIQSFHHCIVTCLFSFNSFPYPFNQAYKHPNCT